MEKIALALPHDGGIVIHGFAGAGKPIASEIVFAALDGSIGGVGYNGCVFRRALIRLVIKSSCAGEILERGVHVAQRKVWNVVIGIGGGQALKILFRDFGIAGIALKISHGFERVMVLRIAIEHARIHLARLVLAVGLPKKIGVLQINIGVGRIKSERLLEVGFGAGKII